MEKGPKYNRVSVLIAYWARIVTDRPHIEEHAKALRIVFAGGFGYETHEIILEDDDDSYLDLHRHFIEIRDLIGSKFEDNLFVLYYGGYGMINGNGNGMWQSREGDSPKMLNWHSAQKLLKGMYFDVLFLFDCCHAQGMVDPNITWRKACDFLWASAKDRKARGTKDVSYTAAFMQFLREQLEKHGRTDTMQLGAMTGDSKWYKMEKRILKTASRYDCFSPGCPRISLVPLKKDATSDDSSTTSSSSTPPNTVG